MGVARSSNKRGRGASVRKSALARTLRRPPRYPPPQGGGIIRAQAPSPKPPRHDCRERSTAHQPLDMRRRRNAPRPSRDHFGLRPQSLRFRHRRQSANQASGRLARAPPMPLARRLTATPPESQHVAVKPLGLHVRRIDQRTAFRKRAPLSVIRRTRRFVECWRHLKVSALFDAYLLLPHAGRRSG